MAEIAGGYVLDGIPTALRVTGWSGSPVEGSFRHIACPCGWSGYKPEAVRFHYTHCPKARVDAGHAHVEGYGVIASNARTPTPDSPNPEATP